MHVRADARSGSSQRASSRAMFFLFALATFAAALLLAAACLPDLAAFPDGPDAADAAVATQGLTCGDGVIDTPDDGGDGGESCDPGDASTAGCEDCRFTCSGGIDDAGHCYFFADPTATYTLANSACRGANGHVVTFASEREAAFVSALAGDAGPYWVGLENSGERGGYAPPSGVYEPGWPSSGDRCAGCFARGTDAGAFDLAPGEDAGALDTCLVATDGRWLRVGCNGTTVRTTLCEREPIGQRMYPCGGLLCTTLPPTAASKRYVVWPSAAAADEARDVCASLDGGSLVIFDSPEEREQLARELRERFQLPVEVWIGLSNADAGWVWDDGRSVDAGPLPWGDGEPSAPTGRAFMRIDDDRFDTQLARVDSTGAPRVFVCQRPF